MPRANAVLRGTGRGGPLHRALEAAYARASADLGARVDRDPVRFPMRYATQVERGGRAGAERRADVEIAAVYASQLAFGRVDLFGPVLERLFAEMDAAGGPAAWCRDCAAGRKDAGDPLVYRWFSRRDFVALGVALARVQAAEGLAQAFTTLEGGIARLRALAPMSAGGPHFATWFAAPSGGSACKRWCMFLRWMVRREAPDLGVWSHFEPAMLTMPVDTHVLRIAQLTGLTARKTADWKTAVEITDRLRAYAPADPTRFDFALAHLGISAGCTGEESPSCEGCALKLVCRIWL